MQPKFATPLAYEQAEQLLQPIYIRLIDNLRKQLESSACQGDYVEQMEPYPGHQLKISYQGQTMGCWDLWQLCFHLCFVDFPLESAAGAAEEMMVVVDPQLLDGTGAIAWQILEDKTQKLVQQLFAGLPVAGES